MRIAIVDDDPIVCQSLETILTATGTAEVLWMANDGDAAVRRYFETPASRPDVLLIDIDMPWHQRFGCRARDSGHGPGRAQRPDHVCGPVVYRAGDGTWRQGLSHQTGCGGGRARAAGGDGRSGGARRGSARQAHRTDSDPADSDDSRDTADSIEGLLGEREREITALVAEGLDNRDIAARLFLSEGTVRNRISAILDKLGLTNRTQLAILWLNAHR